jgi:hypothetical protein
MPRVNLSQPINAGHGSKGSLHQNIEVIWWTTIEYELRLKHGIHCRYFDSGKGSEIAIAFPLSCLDAWTPERRRIPATPHSSTGSLKSDGRGSNLTIASSPETKSWEWIPRYNYLIGELMENATFCCLCPYLLKPLGHEWSIGRPRTSRRLFLAWPLLQRPRRRKSPQIPHESLNWFQSSLREWSYGTKVHSQWPDISYLTPGCNRRYKWCTGAMLMRHPGGGKR